MEVIITGGYTARILTLKPLSVCQWERPEQFSGREWVCHVQEPGSHPQHEGRVVFDDGSVIRVLALYRLRPA